MTPVIAGWVALGCVGLAAVTALTGDAFGRARASMRLAATLLAVAAAACGWVGATEPGVAASPLLGRPGVAAVVFGLGAVVAAALPDHRGEPAAQRAGLVALSAGAAAVMSGTDDLVMLLIAAETLAGCGYALVASAGGRRSDEAAMKYFVQGAVAAAFFTLAVAAIVGRHGGMTGYGPLSGAIGGTFGSAAAMGMALMLGVVAFKLSAFPFHAWAPDAYETAPPEASAFLASAPKLAVAVAAVVLFKQGPFAGAPSAVWAMSALAVASIVYGNLAGLRQSSYTRMLGYSGIAHAGYLLVALSLGLRAVWPVALMGATYAVASAGAFLAAAAVRTLRPGWDGSVRGLRGLGTERPLLAGAVAAFMLSLTGIPLTAGFWGKLLPFVRAVGEGRVGLVTIAVLGSVVSFGYYGRVIRAMYLDDSESGAVAGDGEDSVTGVEGAVTRAAVVVLAAAVVLVGVAPLFTGLKALIAFFG